MAKLILASIRLQPLARRTVETLADAETKSYLPVELRLRNSGRAKTLYFISRPRGIRYDAETRRLTLRFEEPDPAQLLRPSLRKPPTIDSLAPGYETTLVTHVPLVLKTVRTSVRVDQAIVETDLSGVASISCRIAYAETAFSRQPGEAAGEMARRLHQWGERAELTAPCSIPKADDGAGYEPQPAERDPYANTE